MNLIDLRLVRDLHGDNFNSVLARQLKNVRQTFLAMALKRVRTGARFVGAHAGADLFGITQSAHHQIDVLLRIDRAQSGEHMQRVLAKAQSSVIEMRRPVIVSVPADDAVFFRNAHDPLDARQAFHVFGRDR